MELDRCEPANENTPQSDNTISVTDLAAALHISEDDMLQRLAVVLLKREDKPHVGPPGKPHARDRR
jgi:hypothetical protein